MRSLWVAMAVTLFAAEASAQQREPWDGVVVGVQAATVVGHAAGTFAGYGLGAVVGFQICPLFEKCTPSNELASRIIIFSSAAIVGSVAGAASTWGAGRLLDAPGKFLPTLAFAAVGHVAGVITALVWSSLATGPGEDLAWNLSLVIGPVLGTTGAIVGFQSSF